MKQYPQKLFCLLAAGSLLAGCSQKQTVSALPAAPASAPQTLSVYYSSELPAAKAALQAYADAQSVTLTEATAPSAADLAVLDRAPQSDAYRDLREDLLIGAAAARAVGLAESETLRAVPLGYDLYGYWAYEDTLNSLLGENAAEDLIAADYKEWSDWIEAASALLSGENGAGKKAVTLSLNGKNHTLEESAPAALKGIFALPLNSGALTDIVYTPALQAASLPFSEKNLTGPLNGLSYALELELTHCSVNTGRAAGTGALGDGSVLFYRGHLSDISAELGAQGCEGLVCIPFKCNLDKSDITDDAYDLTALLTQPILSEAAWLAIPAAADDEHAKAGASAILWLYGSKQCEELLTNRLILLTPWGSSGGSDLAQTEVNAASAALFPLTLSDETCIALEGAGVTLMESISAGNSDRNAFIAAALAVLAEPENS